MSEKLKESLSAVIDGEADEFELRRVLDEMDRDDRLVGSWERYHVIGSVLRGQRASAGIAMRERVWAELQTDPEASAVTEGGTEIVTRERLAVVSSQRRWKPLAVAATVAVAVVAGYAGYSGIEQTAPAPVVAVEETPLSAEQRSLYETVALSREVTDSDQIRTDAYMVRHYQQIGMDRPGLGFTRMVAYERD